MRQTAQREVESASCVRTLVSNRSGLDSLNVMAGTTILLLTLICIFGVANDSSSHAPLILLFLLLVLLPLGLGKASPLTNEKCLLSSSAS